MKKDEIYSEKEKKEINGILNGWGLWISESVIKETDPKKLDLFVQVIKNIQKTDVTNEKKLIEEDFHHFIFTNGTIYHNSVELK